VGLPVHRVQELGDVIKTLEPKPGRQFADQTETRYIVPDVIVEKVGDDYVVTMNDNSVPRLMVSAYYQNVLREAKNDEKLHDYLSERLNSALWLINSIEQRKQTILNVVKSIVRFQRDYFDKGDKHLRTLTLKQVAEDVGIHESTVSRSINGKYMQCPRGVQELKFFFSAGVSDWQGEGISSNSIKTHLREIIDAEDPKAPLSDQDLVAVLKERGIDISRRTVAKYRDEMNILSSSRRRRF
jgi:RNA polymerase sigma-54 factor